MASRALPHTWAEAVRSTVVRAVLDEGRVIRDLHHQDEAGSTQDLLRDLAVAGAASGTIVIVDRQRSGRGRSGNRWDDDPSGGSLAMSLLLDASAPPLDATSVLLLPHALGLAVVDTAGTIGPDAPPLHLKWPNDVVHRPERSGPARKLAGILVERDRIMGEGGPRDVLLCGVGMNVDLGGDVPDDRTDLASVLGARPERAVLLAVLLTMLDGAVRGLESPPTMLGRLREVSDTVGRAVSARLPGEEPFDGIATAIDATGRLVVRTGDRVRAILSGTIRDAGAGGGDGR